MKPLISKCSMIPAWHQLVPILGHVEESETARKLQLYATSIKTSVSTRLTDYPPIILQGFPKQRSTQYRVIWGAIHVMWHLICLFYLESYGVKKKKKKSITYMTYVWGNFWGKQFSGDFPMNVVKFKNSSRTKQQWGSKVEVQSSEWK